MAKISIVVPVYNAELHVERCIRSLCGQTEEDIEIVLVDDGSNDQSYSICLKYQERDKRVRVFRKNNGGPHSARKMGVHEASGELVTFVDSDDWIEPNAIELMLTNMRDNDADVVVLGYIDDMNCEYNQDCECEQNVNDITDGIYTGERLTREFHEKMLCDNYSFSQKVIPSLWAKLFYKQRLQEIMDGLDDDISMGEDLVCTMTYFLNSEVVMINQKTKIYHYCINNDSITYRYDKKYFDKTVRLYSFLDKVLCKVNNECIKDNFNRYKVYLIYRQFGIMLSAVQWKDVLKTLGLLNEACCMEEVQCALRLCNIAKLRIGIAPKCALYCMRTKKIKILKLLTFVWWKLLALRGKMDLK